VTRALIRRANLARLAAGLVGVALGLGALAVAQGPGRFTTYAGHSGLAATLTVAAGLALVAAGLVTAFSRPAGRIGELAVLAGLIWFAPVWVGWDRGSPLVRSLGMLAAGFTFPLLLHLVVAYPSGRLHGSVPRTLVAAAYLGTAGVGGGGGGGWASAPPATPAGPSTCSGSSSCWPRRADRAVASRSG
jgi:hypothetical protein